MKYKENPKADLPILQIHPEDLIRIEKMKVMNGDSKAIIILTIILVMMDLMMMMMMKNKVR